MSIPSKNLLIILTLCASALGVGSVHADDDPYLRLFQVQLAIAEKGDARAMFALAEMYDNGLGTAENHEKALEWYKRAADDGHWLARKRLEEEAKVAEVAQAQDESARRAEEARARAAIEAKRAAEAAAAARQKADKESLALASAAELAKKKAEDEARTAAEHAAKLAAERKAAAARLAARRAAAKKAMEAIVKQAKSAEGVIQ